MTCRDYFRRLQPTAHHDSTLPKVKEALPAPLHHCDICGKTREVSTNELKKIEGTESTTPPKFHIAPEKCWLEDYFPFGKAYFQGLC